MRQPSCGGLFACYMMLALAALAQGDGSDVDANGTVCEEAAVMIENGKPWFDGKGNEILCQGGHMIRLKDTFYWVGNLIEPDMKYSYFRNVRLYSSNDLAHWTFENNILSPVGPLADFRWCGRPALLRHPKTGRFICVVEAGSPRWERHKVGFTTCNTVNGDYTLVRCVYPDGRSTGDQSVYQEGDHAYLVCTMDKDIGGRKYLNQSLSIWRLTPGFLDIEEKIFEGFDDVTRESDEYPRDQTSREASHIIKVAGVYYWFSSGLAGWYSTATMYATARDLAGPWSELKLLETQPRSDDSFNSQHDIVIPVEETEATTYVYVGDRYSKFTGHGEGNNVMLPLVWEHGQPVLRYLRTWSIDVESNSGNEPH